MRRSRAGLGLLFLATTLFSAPWAWCQPAKEGQREFHQRIRVLDSGPGHLPGAVLEDPDSIEDIAAIAFPFRLAQTVVGRETATEPP